MTTPIKCEVLDDEQNNIAQQHHENHLENGDVKHTTTTITSTNINNSCSSTQTEQPTKYESGIENSLESSYFLSDNKIPSSSPPLSPINFKLNEGGENEELQYSSVRERERGFFFVLKMC